ncbi:hypothetical protein EMCRGX_G014927 [Ephydatia muelleri]
MSRLINDVTLSFLYFSTMTYYLNKVEKLLSSCKDLYNDVNAAYLSGAIDVVVVKQKDGSLKSTPFHVRFGKLGVLRTGDLKKEVEIEVNGTLIDLKMTLDESGSAFFVKSKSEENIISTSADKAATSIDIASLGAMMDQAVYSTSSINTRHNSLPSLQTGPLNFEERRPSDCCAQLAPRSASSVKIQLQDDFHVPIFDEDMDDGGLDVYAMQAYYDEMWAESVESFSKSLPGDLDVLSGEASVQDADSVVTRAATVPSVITTSSCEATHLIPRPASVSDLDADSRDKGMCSPTPGESVVVKPSASCEEPKKKTSSAVDRGGIWNTLTGMLSRKKETKTADVYLGDLDDISSILSEPVHSSTASVSTSPGHTGCVSSPQKSPQVNRSESDDSQKLFSMFDNIAMSLCGSVETVSSDTFHNHQVSFTDFCSDPAVLQNPNLVIRIDGRYYNTQVALPMIMSAVMYMKVLPEKVQANLVKKHMSKKTNRPYFWNIFARSSSAGSTDEAGQCTHDPHRAPRGPEGPLVDVVVSSDEEGPREGLREVPPNVPRQHSFRKREYHLTSKLTSSQLASLPLKTGSNTVVFSITTKYQGTAKAACNIYLWNYSDKLVVSDIDGTITRSDVAGQVFPFLGKDWTQNGVVELFNAIVTNGYRMVYLSARAIGQAGYTKEFLRNIRRGSSKLPDGPLFVMPFSLVTAFKKEVIEKKPDEFKIDCLQELRSLFPDGYNTLHAGFGNKHTDVKSYTKVNIASSRIFTVDPKGQMKCDNSKTFQSSYPHMMAFVDTQFPPLASEEPDGGCGEEFSTFNYWKVPIPSEILLQLP